MTSSPWTLHLYNSMSQRLEAFTPLTPDGVKMYVCGPTVYDDAHLGHARCYITWDVLYRFLGFLGYRVTYVRNVTDVDDKILARAQALGESRAGVAERNYQSFQQDMQALNVLPPTLEPRATDHLQAMLEGIEALIRQGYAYVSPDGSVYYRTHAFPRYGQLSGKRLEDLIAGARVEVDPHKESPTDFALWKATPPEDTQEAYPSPWCPRGRPGWHMECSAMIHRLLGPQIDIHAGGADLIFPHHENEIAQSEGWSGETPFVRYWLHNGFVNVGGEKMSKSLNNFSSIKQILKRYDANTIRYFLLQHHYRMPVDFTDEALQGAENAMKKIQRIFSEACSALEQPPEAGATLSVLVDDFQQEHGRAFLEGMCQDLNTPKALAAFNALMRQWNAPDFTPTVAWLRQAQGMFCLLGFDAGFLQRGLPADALRRVWESLQGSPGEEPPEALLQKLMEHRKEAKALKNWAQADAIRQELAVIGILLKDNKDGSTTWELAVEQPATAG